MGDFLTRTLPRFLYRLTVFINRIRAFFDHTPHLHTARLAHLHELEPLHSPTWDTDPGLLLLDSYENEEASETLGAGSTTTLRPSASSFRMSFRR